MTGSKVSEEIGNRQEGRLIKPKAPIRRFDVFAEYNRLKGLQEGLPPDEAEGYGLWVAKVVASRSFGGGMLSRAAAKQHETEHAEGGKEPADKPKWHALNGKPQTDELFEQEVVRRMGQEFYDNVFVPAIGEAVQSGKSYNAIRDTIRREWRP
ncbi:MAG: hypothetical protein IVW55_01015 [Chloroflexi bacterium]|nr:hypothetical protein [Chloroflexota bacterium]